MILTILATIDNPYENIPYEVDFETLRRVQDMAGSVASILLGLAAWYIIVALFLITALDICYMTIPPLRDAIRNKRWDGAVDNGSKLRIISKDATSAVRESYVGGRNCLAIYIAKRMKTYIIAAVVLYIIIGGSQVIVDIVVHFIGDLLEKLNIV